MFPVQWFLQRVKFYRKNGRKYINHLCILLIILQIQCLESYVLLLYTNQRLVSQHSEIKFQTKKSLYWNMTRGIFCWRLLLFKDVCGIEETYKRKRKNRPIWRHCSSESFLSCDLFSDLSGTLTWYSDLEVYIAGLFVPWNCSVVLCHCLCWFEVLCGMHQHIEWPL